MRYPKSACGYNLTLKLKDSDKKLSDYGLPNPEEYETELQRALLEYDPHQQTELLNHLHATKPNTIEQQNIYNTIAVENSLDVKKSMKPKGISVFDFGVII